MVPPVAGRNLNLEGSVYRFTKCKFNNNNLAKTFDYDFLVHENLELRLIDCDPGNSTFSNKENINLGNASSGKVLFGSIFSTGSLTMIVAFVALVASVASIVVNVTSNKNRIASANENESDQDDA
jgi:hypothetical protein